MKRYVSEFANDMMRKYRYIRLADVEQIEKSLRRGLITEIEAVKAIINLVEESERR